MTIQRISQREEKRRDVFQQEEKKVLATRKSRKSKLQKSADPSIRGEDLTGGDDDVSSEEENDRDGSVVAELCRGPERPKGIPPYNIKKKIDELPVMKLFQHHLGSFEGGNKPKRTCLDHARRIGQMIYQLHNSPDGIACLWQDTGLNTLRRTIFEGNDLLEQAALRC